MKVTKNSKINFLVKTLIDDENILSLKPVIAGGFMADMYNVTKLYDTSDKWNNFKNKFKKDPYLAHDSKFSDIDMYFLDDNIIFDKKNKYNWLIDNNDINRSGMQNIKNFQVQDNIFNFKTGTAHPNANGFIRKKFKSKSEIFQFVLYPQKSIKGMLDVFDIINCTIAWHNDTIYYHDNFERVFLNKELELTEAGWDYIFYKSSTQYRKAYNLLRIFKYMNRYNFKISRELLDSIIKIFKECENEYKNSNKIEGSIKRLDKKVKKRLLEHLHQNLYNLLSENKNNLVNWI
jgi:hypothetical protein